MKQLAFAVLFALIAGTVGAQNHDLSRRADLPDLAAGLPGHPDEADDEGDEGSDCQPDPPCFDDQNRFVDCGNGTVTDQVTGLIWLQDTTCLGTEYWVAYNELAASLGEGTHPACNLTDNSCPGDWRLATKEEWEVILNQAQVNGCTYPNRVFPDTQGLGCWSDGDAFLDITFFFGYWTSTTVAGDPSSAWYGNTAFGGVHSAPKMGGCPDDLPRGVDCDPFPGIYGLPVRK